MNLTDSIIKLLKEKEFAKAEIKAINFLKDDLVNAQLWVLLGEALLNQHQGDSAKLAFNRAWLLDPQASWVESVKSVLDKTPRGKVKPEIIELLMVPKVTVTAAMIVKDEERSIRRAIESILTAVDEIVIVDTGSTDGTIEIIKSYPNIKLIHFNWINDFAAARNAALPHINGDWVFWIDADEYLNPDDVNSVREAAGLFTHKDQCFIFNVWKSNHIGDITKDFFDESRMFPNRFNLHYKGKVHEQILPAKLQSGVTYKRVKVRIRLEHDGYDPSIMESKNKFERNINLLKKMTEEEPDNPTAWYFLGRDTLNSGETLKGIEYLEEAQKRYLSSDIQGRLLEVQKLLAQGYLKLGDYSKAINICEKALEIDPSYPEASFYLAKAKKLMATHLINEANELLLKVKKEGKTYRGNVSTDPMIVNGRTDLVLADLAIMSGRLGLAHDLYHHSMKYLPINKGIQQQLEFIKTEYQYLNNKNL